MRGALLAGALLCALCPLSARAGAKDQNPADAGHGGTPQASSPPTSDEDREVIENLDLLQAMEGAKDLDLLLELNKVNGDGEGD